MKQVATVLEVDPAPRTMAWATSAALVTMGVTKQHGHVEELVDGVGADHACLAQQGVDRDIHAGQRAGVGAGGAGSGLGAPALRPLAPHRPAPVMIDRSAAMAAGGETPERKKTCRGAWAGSW
jgi:hypothetical protein